MIAEMMLTERIIAHDRDIERRTVRIAALRVNMGVGLMNRVSGDDGRDWVITGYFGWGFWAGMLNFEFLEPLAKIGKDEAGGELVPSEKKYLAELRRLMWFFGFSGALVPPESQIS
jgi:hypothetical protein